jgi:hypothetical protein
MFRFFDVYSICLPGRSGAEIRDPGPEAIGIGWIPAGVYPA